jgi:2-polyprenyl-3-methyl-5-hydroxy-6-metoxy-1,4-benzoquinol methylase
MADSKQPGMEDWLRDLRERFAADAELLGLFDIYASEALFGRRFIAADLERLPTGSEVLEVGAGAMLLSCQLAREGFRVTALEPVGSGFGHFARMRAIVLEAAGVQGCAPRLLDSTAEALDIVEQFPFVFSINVMEHVADVEAVVRNVVASLRPGGSYRFTCPNYLFPYEPHFNIPTLFSKPLTARVLRAKIHGRGIADAEGLWRSLNWINVLDLRRIASRLPGARITFDRLLLVDTLERIGTDPTFAGRRSPLARTILKAIVRLRLHHLLGWAPAAVQPVIDCRVERPAASGVR